MTENCNRKAIASVTQCTLLLKAINFSEQKSSCNKSFGSEIQKSTCEM